MIGNTRMAAPATRVLVIDDGGHHADELKTVFSRSRGQYQVSWAFDLADTVQSVYDNEHDVCLLPIDEPTPVTEYVTEERVDFPVILLTTKQSGPEVYEIAFRNRMKYLSIGDLQPSDLEHAMTRSIRKPLQELTNYQQSAALETATDGIAIVNSSSVISFANQSMADIHGYFSPSDLLNTDIRSLYADEYTNAVGYAAMEAARAEGNWQGEATGLRSDGSTFPKEVTVRAMDDNGFVFVERDATATHELRAQLYQSQKTEGIGQLAGGIVHDFNNLLSAVMGYSQLGLAKIDRNHPMREYFEEIDSAAERAAELTRRLLTFSSKTIADPEIVDLNKSISGINSMLVRLISEDIELSTWLEPELSHVEVDPGQIEQVLVNLVVNARDAMPNGGQLAIKTENVEIGRDRPGQNTGMNPGRYALLTVKDNGTGISDEVMARLFEPFFTTKSEETGTGLGLSICSGIVAEFGGAIQVDSNPGEGATFRVYLPSAAVKSAPITPVVQALPDIQSSTRTVLVAEDENAVRRMLASVLQQRGYTVMQAPNGQEALKIANQLRDGEIDLLLTDMIMPVMGGRALANEFKELHPSAKVLYTSGYTSDDIMLSDDLGADSAFMRKPFDLTTVSQQVHDLLKATPLRAA